MDSPTVSLKVLVFFDIRYLQCAWVADAANFFCCLVKTSLYLCVFKLFIVRRFSHILFSAEYRKNCAK